jgi:hypothetical protein
MYALPSAFWTGDDLKNTGRSCDAERPSIRGNTSADTEDCVGTVVVSGAGVRFLSSIWSSEKVSKTNHIENLDLFIPKQASATYVYSFGKSFTTFQT